MRPGDATPQSGHEAFGPAAELREAVATRAEPASRALPDAPPPIARLAERARVSRRAARPAGTPPAASSPPAARTVATPEAERTEAGPGAAAVAASPPLLRAAAGATPSAAPAGEATAPPADEPIEEPGNDEPDPVDLERLAQEVYARLKRRFIVNRERAGLGVRR